MPRARRGSGPQLPAGFRGPCLQHAPASFSSVGISVAMEIASELSMALPGTPKGRHPSRGWAQGSSASRPPAHVLGWALAPPQPRPASALSPSPAFAVSVCCPRCPSAVSSLVLHRSGAQRGFAGVHGAPVSGASGESGQSPSHSWGLWVSPPPSLTCCRSHGQLQVRVGVGLSPCGG